MRAGDGRNNPRAHARTFRLLRKRGMLLILAILLLLLWGGGFALHVAGSLVHILIVIALVLFILHFVRGGRSV